MISMLEARRRAARAHDQLQRDAEEAATQARSAPTSRLMPTLKQPEPVSVSDQLAELLVSDARRVVTTADLRAVIAYLDERLDDLRDELLDADESL